MSPIGVSAQTASRKSREDSTSLLLATFKLPFHPFCFFTCSCSCCPFQKGDNAFHRGVEGQALRPAKGSLAFELLGRRS